MPETQLEVYFPVILQALIACAVGAGMIGISFLLGKKLKNKVKDSPYECGVAPIGSARERFSVKFYLVAMIFILFDLEAIFLFPWVVVYKDLGWFGFVVMLLFVDLILGGFYYIYKKGVLDWSPIGGQPRKP
jgi:NADH-quinone oxidoreductase subunit A